MLSGKDTIIACSSPPGRGAISIIRLSGDKAFTIIQKVTKNKLKKQISVVKFPLDKDLVENKSQGGPCSVHSFCPESLSSVIRT